MIFTHFEKLNSASVAGSDSYDQLINFASCNSSFDEIFTLEEIVQSLRIRNKFCLPGFDNIINEFLKNSRKCFEIDCFIIQHNIEYWTCTHSVVYRNNFTIV